jgi:cyclomaltodextrinase / maltogenic alpha-amylase / neopullulanase
MTTEEPSNRDKIDENFRNGSVVTRAAPSHFYFNLTERCQLKCQHCITGAPDLTARKTARDMGDDVLAAVLPHLRHAEYVGFPHAGEPILSPLLLPLLDGLRSMRQELPTTVHLLTNGMAMTEERFSTLVDKGVNSLSFSLDGMSASTNDSLRVGSDIGRLLERLLCFAKLRSQQNLDVRMGVSFTVTRMNLHEVDEAVERFAAIGIDWLKLEELFPMTEAMQAWVPDENLLREVVTRATTRAHALGIVLVDHTRAVDNYKCTAQRYDGSVPPRRAGLGADACFADDFANRFDINPCRLPFQLVCIEPDGGVKPISFHHPRAGNVCDTDLAEIFHSPGFDRVRERQLSQRPCQPTMTTCPGDCGPPHRPRPGANGPTTDGQKLVIA